MQTQAAICPNCMDDHEPPCSVDRMSQLVGQMEVIERELRTENARLRAEVIDLRQRAVGKVWRDLAAARQEGGE